MADGDTQPPQPPDYTQQLLALVQQLQGNQQPVQPDQTPVSRGWLSLLGQGLGGGGGDVPMSPQQQETAGLRSLLGFGTSLMQSARYQPGATIFSRLGEGMEGAQRAMTSTEQLDAQQLAARQAYQQQQFQNHMEALKTAIPMLTLNQQAQQAAAARGVVAGNQPGALTTTASPGSLPIINRDPSIPVAGAQANNPGNVMAASGLPGQTGYIPLQGGRTLAAFPDLPTGYAAAARNLITYQDVHGINTVQDAVKRWVLGPNPDPKAPQPDLTSYTADISKALGVKPTDTVDFHDPKVLEGFLTAQVPHETGGKGGITVNPDDVTKGVQMALGGYKPPTGPPAATAATTPPAASTATPAPPTAPRGAATLPTPPLPPEGMLPSPIGAPAAAPASAAGQPAGGAVVAGPPGAATVGAAKPPGPAVPGDVNAILRGMIARGASPATLLPGLPGAAAPGGASTLAAGPAVTSGESASAVAQAQATNTPVPVPGGQGLWALPNGQLTSTRPAAGMPATAPQLPPPPAPAPPPPTPATSATAPPPPPSPHPDITVAGTTISHPGRYKDFHDKQYTPPPASELYNPNLTPAQEAVFAARQQTIDKQTQLLNSGAVPLTEQTKAAADLIAARGSLEADRQTAIQTKKEAAAKATSEWDAPQEKAIGDRYALQLKNYDDAVAKAGANEAAERQTRLSGEETRLTGEATDQGKRNSDILNTYRDGATSGGNVHADIQQARSVLSGMTQDPASLLNNETLKPYLTHLSQTVAQHATNNDLFTAAMQRAADEMSPRTSVGGERPSNVGQYRLMLPGLATSPEGRELALNFADDIAQNKQDQYEWLVSHRNDDRFINKRINQADGDQALVAMRHDPTVQMPALPPMPSSFDGATFKASPTDAKAQTAYARSITPGQPFYTWQVSPTDGRVHAVKSTWTLQPDGKTYKVNEGSVP